MSTGGPAASATSAFDAATAVERTNGGSGPLDVGARGTWSASLDAAWQIGGKANGGYLLAVLARAALAGLGPEHPHPTSVCAVFLSAPDEGPAEVQVEVLRRGRSASQARARLVSDGAVRVEALVTAGVLEPSAPAWWDGVEEIALPPMEDCVRLPVEAPGFRVPLMGVVGEHLDPACLGWTAGQPSGAGELRAWVRLDDDRDHDPLSLLLAVDCLPPASFDLGSRGWVPTLQLTAYVRALPAPGPLRVRQRARTVAGDRMDEVCDVVDARGALVASGVQLAGLRLPDGPAPGTLAR